jgi:thymidylate synthase (FAD)
MTTLDPLNDKISCVDLQAVMGNDLTVVNAARVSFAKESLVLDQKDSKLINYLAKNGHISPFFHPQIRLRLKMPIFVAREWFRHTIGFSRNEVSRRYVDEVPEVYNPMAYRERDSNVKQGSKDTNIENNDKVVTMCKELSDATLKFYSFLLDSNVAPEMARMVLPQSMYTEFVETASLYAYARLCRLRLDPHAQKEIRDYAEAVSKLLSEQFPVSWLALMGQKFEG